MRTALSIILSLLIISLLNSSTIHKEEQPSSDSFKKMVLTFDTNAMLKPIPNELIISQTVNDSDIFVTRNRCVVLAKYSEGELLEIEKNSKSADEWNAFYEDYIFYNDGVSMFICERAMVYIESEKKYIQFILASGVKITIDRKKSAGRLFFFNPKTGVKQCFSADFRREKYTDF